jgi:hypothetical protein
MTEPGETLSSVGRAEIEQAKGPQQVANRHWNSDRHRTFAAAAALNSGRTMRRRIAGMVSGLLVGRRILYRRHANVRQRFIAMVLSWHRQSKLDRLFYGDAGFGCRDLFQ